MQYDIRGKDTSSTIVAEGRGASIFHAGKKKDKSLPVLTFFVLLAGGGCSSVGGTEVIVRPAAGGGLRETKYKNSPGWLGGSALTQHAAITYVTL